MLMEIVVSGCKLDLTEINGNILSASGGEKNPLFKSTCMFRLLEIVHILYSVLLNDSFCVLCVFHDRIQVCTI